MYALLFSSFLVLQLYSQLPEVFVIHVAQMSLTLGYFIKFDLKSKRSRSL